jgi:copper chaperone CopZ
LCRLCDDAVKAGIFRVVGVEDIRVDPETRWVVVRGQELDVAAIRTAVDERATRQRCEREGIHR